MASKHLRDDRKRSPSILVLVAAFFAVATAAVVAGLALNVTDGTATATAIHAPAPAVSQPLSQEGRLVAVSPTSVTAESVDGFARTYVIDAQTNAITPTGSSVGGAATSFAVNDEVAIVGVVRDGTAVATAVAAKQVANLDGPPMDAV